MPSGRKKNKWSARQERRSPQPATPTSPLEHNSAGVATDAGNAAAPSSAKWNPFERVASSVGVADGDEEMGYSGGLNTNGATSASPPPSHCSHSDESAGRSEVSPAAPPLSPSAVMAAQDIVSHHSSAHTRAHHRDITADLAEDEEPLMRTADGDGAAVESADEIFYVQLDPESQAVTGVLPEMEQLHVQLTKLRRVLRQNGAVLHALRERARAAGDDACELHPSPPSASISTTSGPHSHSRRRTAELHRPPHTVVPDGATPASRLDSARAPRTSAERSRPSPRFAPLPRPGGTPPLAPSTAAPRRFAEGEADEESEWCDAATINSSGTTTAQSTPSLRPALPPPPHYHLFEEDEMDDDGRGSHLSSITGVRRTYVARFRPDSVPSSIHSTPNLQPAGASYARSDGGGVLCLPPSTLSVARGELPLQLSLWNTTATSPTAASPGGSVMSRLENSPLLPPATSASARLFESHGGGEARARTLSMSLSGTTPRGGRLSESERAELARLSCVVAELYHRRGVLLQRADRILCQHAQQHERWEGNEERRGCYRCRRLFSRLTRRHHCRRCGRLCCAECSRYVGKKQDTSYVAPSSSARGPASSVVHRVIIKSEYTARMTADDAHALAEESFDEHTYPRRGTAAAASPVSPMAPRAANAASAPEAEAEQELENGSFADARASPNSRVSRSRQHRWVRVCAPCYQNCLRARRNNVLQYLKNANLCILDDGYYYYHVMTKEELCQLSTALSKPDSFKKQVELMSHVVMERSVDYVAAAPGYSAQTIATAVQHTPDVLRTIGGISAYAFRSARQTANDYVGGYFNSSRTILPDHPVGSAALASLAAARDGADDGECSEASVESLEDTCSGTQSPTSPASDGDDDAEATALPTSAAEREPSAD